MENRSRAEALRIVWATPLGGGIAGFVIGFLFATAAAIIAAFSGTGHADDILPVIATAFFVGVVGIPFGAGVGIGSAVLGGLVIAALRMSGEWPSSPMLVIAGAAGTLPGSLLFAGLVSARAPLATGAIIAVVAAVAAVAIWYLLRADLTLPAPADDADALAEDAARHEGGL